MKIDGKCWPADAEEVPTMEHRRLWVVVNPGEAHRPGYCGTKEAANQWAEAYSAKNPDGVYHVMETVAVYSHGPAVERPKRVTRYAGGVKV